MEPYELRDSPEVLPCLVSCGQYGLEPVKQISVVQPVQRSINIFGIFSALYKKRTPILLDSDSMNIVIEAMLSTSIL